MKVPRSKDEPGKGGFWCLDPQFADTLVDGVFRKKRPTRSTAPPPRKCKRTRRPLFHFHHPTQQNIINQQQQSQQQQQQQQQQQDMKLVVQQQVQAAFMPPPLQKIDQNQSQQIYVHQEGKYIKYLKKIVCFTGYVLAFRYL